MRLVSVVTSTRSSCSTQQVDLGQQVVDLRAHRTQLDLGIDEPGRSHDLLDDLARM
jgi:hypothetical protein